MSGTSPPSQIKTDSGPGTSIRVANQPLSTVSWRPPEDAALFATYDVPQEVKKGIRDAGFSRCTEIQSRVLPIALQGKDIAAQSQTGTGKTAAFLITIFSRLIWQGCAGRRGPHALIIAPTRELAVQIEKDARVLGQHAGLSLALCFGGVDYHKQRREIALGPNVLIGTPGRLIDFLKQGVWQPGGITTLVIDEADRLFDMGFIADLRFILRRLPPYDKRQSLLFSATLGWRVLELTYEYMNLPVHITASPEQVTSEGATETLYHVSRQEKPALLLGLMGRGDWSRTMVFTNTKNEAERVEKLLSIHKYQAKAITGDLEQSKRLRLMEDFKKGRLPILVATDVASRGLHVEGVSHVVNWDLPQDAEDYVHRIGRTARAGATGSAITLADEHTVLHLESIEKLIGHKIPVQRFDDTNLAPLNDLWARQSSIVRKERTKRDPTGKSPSQGRGVSRPGRRPSRGTTRSRQGGRPLQKSGY